ncbi:hypothetical protein QL992_09585 [Microbacterium sp. APC 3898]|nr:hypothetical protein [Microbacterium sp. APC 3898]MDN3499467.1 hypothetical protein [Microbacterium sp. APC 3898]
MEIENLIDVKTRQELREWLAENSATEKFCWVVVSVKEQPGVVQYLDAVEEALCFGWIDSTKKNSPRQRQPNVFRRGRKTAILPS